MASLRRPMALCGGLGLTPEERKLRDAEAQLAAQRREAAAKDRNLHQDTATLVQTLEAKSLQARQKMQLLRDLASADSVHEMELAQHRSDLEAEHREAFHSQVRKAEETHTLLLREAEGSSRPSPEAEEQAQASFKEELAQAQITEKERLQKEELRKVELRQEMESLREQVLSFTRERDSELHAARLSQEAYLSERQAAERHTETLVAEARRHHSERESLEGAHRSLQSTVKVLQSDHARATYAVGQKDHELKVKCAELQEVHHGLASVHQEMDEVNRQLQEQCNRVQRVESTLRSSGDLSEKVRNMRQMLIESHSVMGQLNDLLEQERSRRELSQQTLKQQRLRTELLLQLLHHFKSRTQELAPQALQTSAEPAAEPTAGGDLPVQAAEPTAPHYSTVR